MLEEWLGLGVAAPRPEMLAAASRCVAKTRYTAMGAAVTMDQQNERQTYPHDSRNPRQEAENVVASDCSATSENMNHGDDSGGGETTQGANRFAPVGSSEPKGGAKQVTSFKEITQAVFSSWIGRRQQVMKESRGHSQKQDESHRDNSPATPLVSKESFPTFRTHRPAK